MYYLARMLEAGEDARFIARRMVILASEDIGMADPQSLLVAVAAAHALEHVGLPEAQLNLARRRSTSPPRRRATAPRSPSGTRASDVQTGAIGEVPAPPARRHYKGAASLGHGAGYEYPHDDQRGWVAQQYLPTSLVGRRWYGRATTGTSRRCGSEADGTSESTGGRCDDLR